VVHLLPPNTLTPLCLCAGLLTCAPCQSTDKSPNVHAPVLGTLLSLRPLDLLCCGAVRCGVVWCGAVWCGVVPCGVVWCAVLWCGVVCCGVLWCAVVCCAELRQRTSVWAKERGGAFVTEFVPSDLEASKVVLSGQTMTEHVTSSEELWANLQYFLKKARGMNGGGL
jgi:hypothetical protein